MTDILKVLTELSFDNLFVLTGLAFLAFAILGNVSGKFDMGKTGRIAAGVFGPFLVGAGLWMHASHGLKITSLGITALKHSYDSCPASVELQGIIEATGSGAVIYAFEFSDGTLTPAQRLQFDKSDSKVINVTWPIGALNNGWARLKTLSPQKVVSDEQAALTVTCAHATPSPEHAEVKPPPSSRPAARAPSPRPEPLATPPPRPPQEPMIDSVRLLSTSPSPETVLQRGRPLQFNVDLLYTLASANSAILTLSIAEIPASAAGCSGSGGELSDATQVPIVRGQHRVKVLLTWSGDTGAATKGRVYGKGYLVIVPMFWAENNGARGERIKVFEKDLSYCYRFGP